ncbi:hypothetical protein BDV29DRAFT_104256 [Aspergillus leporis]|uniref:Uncharacterized protein n=1 Tax=Aspergillus leporis TaxID=41062 RepID=A0A5N5X4H8_9EURO|nr:hypothetical protein BDV29DRAFT_104256 [Aspergillus leporis]
MTPTHLFAHGPCANAGNRIRHTRSAPRRPSTENDHSITYSTPQTLTPPPLCHTYHPIYQSASLASKQTNKPQTHSFRPHPCLVYKSTGVYEGERKAVTLKQPHAQSHSQSDDPPSNLIQDRDRKEPGARTRLIGRPGCLNPFFFCLPRPLLSSLLPTDAVGGQYERFGSCHAR